MFSFRFLHHYLSAVLGRLCGHTRTVSVSTLIFSLTGERQSAYSSGSIRNPLSPVQRDSLAPPAKWGVFLPTAKPLYHILRVLGSPFVRTRIDFTAATWVCKVYNPVARLRISLPIEKIIDSLNLARRCPGREVGGTARRSTNSAAPLGAQKMGWIVAV